MKDMEKLLQAYGKATQLSPPEELIERTKVRLTRPTIRRSWLVLAAILGLPLLYGPLVLLIILPMSLPELLLHIGMVSTFYNALIIILWLTRAQISKLAQEVLS